MLTITSKDIRMTPQRFQKILAGQDRSWGVVDKDHTCFTVVNKITGVEYQGIYSGLFQMDNVILSKVG